MDYVMKTKNILHLTYSLCGLCLLCVLSSSCEDYTEHNFGKPEDLYQNEQVNSFNVELTPANYQEMANNADNIALAQAADTTGKTLQHLKMAGEAGCFTDDITPQEYLPALLKSLIGAGQFYSLTKGSSITVKYKTGTVTAAAAYIPNTGNLTTSGNFLLVPKGQQEVLTNSNNAATGQTYSYGYIYLSGSTRFPNAVTHVDTQTILADSVADSYAYHIGKDGSTWIINNGLEQYLYLDDTHNTFQYIEDLGDLDDDMYPSWNITYNEGDSTYSIVNAENQKVMLFGTSFGSAGAYGDKLDDTGKPVEGYVGIQLYKRVDGLAESIVVSEETEEVTFTLEEEGWQAKGDYLNQELTGGSTLTDMDAVYEYNGWSVEYIGGIGDLTYVWRYDATYGLRASAFKSSTYYPTDAWAISPVINLKKAVKPVFTFEQAQKYADNKASEEDKVTDYLKVFVSTNYTGRGGLEAATWTDVTEKVEGTWPDGSDWTYYPMTLDLSDYAGQPTVNVAFRYISTDAVAATWEVKNVVCKENED